MLIESGADIYAKTYLEETVLELSDDIDVREFIVQKKKEIDNNQKVVNRAKSVKRNSVGVTRRFVLNSSFVCLLFEGFFNTQERKQICLMPLFPYITSFLCFI
jgi:hypothetical protein